MSIEDALKAGQLKEAQGMLLAAWEKSRDPGAARLIEALDARLPKSGSWDTHESASVPLLLENLVVRLSETKVRIELLNKLPPDPRIAMHYARMFQDPPFQSNGSLPIWTLIAEGFSHHADPRAIPILEALVGCYQEKLAGRSVATSFESLVKKSIKLLKKALTPTPPSYEPLETLLKLLAPLPSPSPSLVAKARTAEDFLAAIAADPDSDELRLVYADFLQEQNDPRGEFISLQIQRAMLERQGQKSSPDALKREKQLLKTHQKEWLQVFGGAFRLDDLHWERGFLSKAELKYTLPAREFQYLLDNPYLSTLSSLNVQTDSRELLPFLRQPSLKGLKILKGLKGEDATILLNEGAFPRLELVHWRYSRWGMEEPMLVNQHLESFKNAPSTLTEVQAEIVHYYRPSSLDAPDYLPLIQGPLGKNLKKISLSHSSIGAWLQLLPTLELPLTHLQIGITKWETPTLLLEKTETGWDTLTVDYGISTYSHISNVAPLFAGVPDNCLKHFTLKEGSSEKAVVAQAQAFLNFIATQPNAVLSLPKRIVGMMP